MASDLARLLGDNIRVYRKRRELTQEKLADAVKVSTPYMNLMEAGKKFPSEEKILRLAEVLGVEPYELFLDPKHDSARPEVASSAISEDFIAELTKVVERFTAEYQKRSKG